MKRRMMTKFLVLALGGGFMLQSGANAACTRNVLDQALISVNACFIFDCQNGILGGLINPCTPGQEIFVDCANLP